GFLVCPLLGALPGAGGRAGVVAGVAAWGVSSAITGGAWFSLLSGVAPPGVRGRFFGKLRFSWQLTGVVFTALAAPFLAQDTPVLALQCLLGAVTLSMFVRPVIFTAIPDLERPEPLADGFIRSMLGLARIDSYASFVAYAFLLALFTAGCPALFGLVEKRFLGLGDNTVLWLGNVFMIGSMIGYFAGGKVVDRWGTKPVFLICHFTFAATLIAYVLRGFAPGPVVWTIGTIRFVFGLVMAASSVAISTEMLAICPAKGLSLSTSVCNTMYVAGSSLSGLMSGWALKLGFLQKQWTLMGAPLSEYNAILLVYGVMVGLLVVTLGLAPSVIGKAEWYPRP
ncbi:MAG TPA: MFS transporter, partial [Candidatus Brocadiia bacterium]|nr:MFS transporter [Candidatus Brocadiia bacterium]